MDTGLIQSKFAKIGARVHFRTTPLVRDWRDASLLTIDIRQDRRGEFYDVLASPHAEVEVLDVRQSQQHLLLMFRQPVAERGRTENKQKFLCGHDERHWFVAGIPENSPVSTVVTAMEELKPRLVRQLERGLRGRREHRLRRKTETFVRQGEWFFVPMKNAQINERLLLKNEPIQRGRGKPHRCEFLYREGGTRVYVSEKYPNGITDGQYKKLITRHPEAIYWRWRIFNRNPAVYVRGRISHVDHATIRLDGWHEVQMNTEYLSNAMASVAFLD
jgi:hypothetical protein